MVIDTNGTSGQNVGNIHPECTEAGIWQLPANGEQGPVLFILIHSHGMPIFIGAA